MGPARAPPWALDAFPPAARTPSPKGVADGAAAGRAAAREKKRGDGDTLCAYEEGVHAGEPSRI
eukprot:gene4140-2014_t